MAQPALTDAQKREALDAFKKHGSKKGAARALGISESTFRNRFDRANAPEDVKGDPIETNRLKKSLSIERSRANDLEKFAAQERTIREAAFGLAARPLTPPNWKVRPDRVGKSEAIILPLSDIHMGEVVKLSAMGGRNSYGVEIAKKRLSRYFQNVVKLATDHWTGPKPGAIYLVLMGDMVSGEIHDELAKTNELLALPAVRVLAECLAAGIELLSSTFKGIPINIISVPGNHGRTTRKPESKEFAVNSYDTLTAWLLESWAKARKLPNVSFSAPESGDALVNVLGWNILFTHGDRIGSRGGQGYVGTAATATRGMKKLVEDFLSEGQIIDCVIMGHFHTPLQLEYGFVNGSVPGPTEYSRSGRFKSHPASQWMLTVHPTRGIARRWLLALGDPSEGTIYKGRSA